MTDKKATIKKRILELFESKGTRFPVSAEYVTLKVAHGSHEPARIWERNLRLVEGVLRDLAAEKQIEYVKPDEEIKGGGYIPPMRTITLGDTAGHNNFLTHFKASDMDADTLACGEPPEKRQEDTVDAGYMTREDVENLVGETMEDMGLTDHFDE